MVTPIPTASINTAAIANPGWRHKRRGKNGDTITGFYSLSIALPGRGPLDPARRRAAHSLAARNDGDDKATPSLHPPAGPDQPDLEGATEG